MSDSCTHLDKIRFTDTNVDVCQDCIKTGDSWVHLRMCMICGHVGCCNESKNRHATKHFKASTHPLARSIEPGENWIWCYVDEVGMVPEVEERK